jgi:hypothetical protein
VVQSQPKILSENETKAKRAGGMAQMIEYLPSKSEILNSNPNMETNKQIYKNVLSVI